MRIYLGEQFIEIDEAVFDDLNLERHTTGRRSHILEPGEEFNWRDPKFDSSMSPEDYAREAELLSNAPAGKYSNNSDPEHLKNKVFGWVFNNPKYGRDKKFKVRIPSEPTKFNPNALPELVIYSMDDSAVISYMLLKGPRSLYDYGDQFVKELDEKLELSEDVIDEESDINFDYDYKTSEADVNAKDVFDIHRSDSSYSTGLLPGSSEEDYYRDNKNKKGEIVYMTPEEYFEKCAEGFKSTVEKLKKSRMQYPGHEHIEDIKKIITEKGKKLPIPYLDYTNGFGQEGLHRMMAVAELFDWNETKFPVLVITFADEQRHIESLKWQDQYKIEHDVIEPALRYHFEDEDEFIEELKYELESWRNEDGWEYIKDPKKLIVEFDGKNITFTDPDSDFKFSTDEYTHRIVFEPAEEREKATIDDFDLADLSDEELNDLLLIDSVNKKKVKVNKDAGNVELANAIFNNSADTTSAPISESIEKHDTLNPKLWGDNEDLLPEVREGIEKIVYQFVTELKENDVELKVLDTVLVGSNASYNYTKDSDLDVHIIVDTSIIPCEYGLLPIIYNMAKSQFNSKYDITLHDVPVELYVEDMNTSANSNGIYSLKNGWVKKPVAMDIPEIDISDTYPEWEDRAKDLLEKETTTIEDVNKFIDDVYLLRKSSIMADGEYGKGNLVFKELRNNGYLDQLKELKVKLTEKDMIVEKTEE